MSKLQNAVLRPYGFIPGKEEGWCAGCNRTFKNAAPNAFKCHPCAYRQWNVVEEECRAAGMEG